MSYMGELRIELDEYEAGELTFEEMLELFAKLIESGMIGTLRPHYQRTAAGLIEDDLITEGGDLVT